MRVYFNNRIRGFTLIELMASLVISAMVVISVIGVYSRARSAARAINRYLNGSEMPVRISQAAAEDVDRIVVAGADVAITVENKFANGLNICRFTIESKVVDSTEKERLFEKVVWQSRVEADSNGLILYRARTGMELEDKLLDGQLLEWKDRELYVPMARGLTYFKVQALQGDQYVDKWETKERNIPRAVRVLLSFAAPVKTVTGELEVPEEEIISRVIAVDRTRKIAYRFVKQTFDLDEYIEDPNDPNDPNDMDPNDFEDEEYYEEDEDGR